MIQNSTWFKQMTATTEDIVEMAGEVALALEAMVDVGNL
jgi:hypothetical protein